MNRQRPRIKKTPYQRIVAAAEKGVGLRLSAEECRLLKFDGDIELRATNDDLLEEDAAEHEDLE